MTRWKRDEKGEKVLHPHSGKPILQFVSILRKDNNEWAIPGVLSGLLTFNRFYNISLLKLGNG